MIGGAMRQVGVLCAAALHALDHHVERVVDDHENARRLAEGVADARGITLDLASVQTNIVNLDVEDAPSFALRAKERGLLVSAMGPRRIRAVTHLDVDRQGIDRAIGILREVAAS
jgi:threonine aldolase